MKYMGLHPGKMTNEHLLSLQRKNLQCLHDYLDIHFDSMFINKTPWLHAIKFLGAKFPMAIRNAISPAHGQYLLNIQPH